MPDAYEPRVDHVYGQQHVERHLRGDYLEDLIVARILLGHRREQLDDVLGQDTGRRGRVQRHVREDRDATLQGD